ncbi:probable conserved transmembrane protein [Pseudonocardia sp. N23]|nr:probable conserved transmembrane protein [Pseudonocardia sp. N23]
MTPAPGRAGAAIGTAYPGVVPALRTSRVAALALAADVVAVLVFAAIGRAGHDEAGGIGGVLVTAAPFVIGLGVAWATPWVRARPAGFAAGGTALAGTVVIGLLLRAAFTGRLPLTFALVTLVALAVLLVGWRGVSAVVAEVVDRRASRSARR